MNCSFLTDAQYLPKERQFNTVEKFKTKQSDS